ncbi:MAG: NYN domain-containing protein [Planctomycetes bacterium]|nr:NYN domain-containing protein [Planctomycetota bacterium]
MVTNVYIDAFNLYFGSLKKTPYKWLDLVAMSRLLLKPYHKINKVKVFAALVKPRPNDLTQPQRQMAYFRALRTLPEIEIIEGHYLSHEVRMPLAGCAPGQQKFATVIKTEEKGSDVNLATHLLFDAFRNDYECAVLVSNDSDLQEPLRIVRQELQKRVGVLNPHKHPSRMLTQHAHFVKTIRTGVLAHSQLPPILYDAHGTIHKPPTW